MITRPEFLRLAGRLLGKLWLGEPTGKVKEVRIYTEDVSYHITERDILKFHDGE